MPDAKDVVRRFFDTLGTGDFATIGEFFTDESTWMVNDVARGFPAQHGRKGIIDDFLQPIREGLFEPGDPKVEIRSADRRGRPGGGGDHGAGHAANGNPYENPYVFIIEVAGDTVMFLREYMDSDYAHSVSAGAGGGDGAEEHVAETLRRLGHDSRHSTTETATRPGRPGAGRRASHRRGRTLGGALLRRVSGPGRTAGTARP